MLHAWDWNGNRTRMEWNGMGMRMEKEHNHCVLSFPTHSKSDVQSSIWPLIFGTISISISTGGVAVAVAASWIEESIDTPGHNPDHPLGLEYRLNIKRQLFCLSLQGLSCSGRILSAYNHDSRVTIHDSRFISHQSSNCGPRPLHRHIPDHAAAVVQCSCNLCDTGLSFEVTSVTNCNTVTPGDRASYRLAVLSSYSYRLVSSPP
jgi:hypothetical protein